MAIEASSAQLSTYDYMLLQVRAFRSSFNSYRDIWEKRKKNMISSSPEVTQSNRDPFLQYVNILGKKTELSLFFSSWQNLIFTSPKHWWIEETVKRFKFFTHPSDFPYIFFEIMTLIRKKWSPFDTQSHIHTTHTQYILNRYINHQRRIWNIKARDAVAVEI